MARPAIVLAVTALELSAPAAGAVSECKLTKLLEIPVTMSGLRPLVPAKVNGVDENFVLDSGAFWSMITPAKATELKLKLGPPPWGMTIEGIGGNTNFEVATVNQFAIGRFVIPKVQFIVAGNDAGYGAAGFLGQNLLRVADVEYDLANGAVRLVRAKDCRGYKLAYWATKEQPYSVIDITAASLLSPHTIAIAYVNGQKIRVIFDTGAGPSYLSLRAAERAGVKPGAAGVLSSGTTEGVGRRPVDTWIAPFASFKIGDEEVRNTKLRIGDLGYANADMLLGADFFLSHHIYVASSQSKLFFTYNGGPVFNLKSAPVPDTGSRPPPEASDQPVEDAKEPTDAAGFSRRGSAFAARHDFEHAIADLTRACELNPKEPSYLYRRGQARLDNKEPALALADFDEVLRLKPDDTDALLTRAALRIDRGLAAEAAMDIDNADRAVAQEAEQRYAMSLLYLRLGLLAKAIGQFDLWIAAHPKDAQLANALHGRCWARAALGQGLDKALADCNAALRLSPGTERILEARAHVRMELGDLDKSIADYDAALKLQPNNALSLYGRGVDKLREGKTSEGNADIAAATALRPHITDEAQKIGIAP